MKNICYNRLINFKEKVQKVKNVGEKFATKSQNIFGIIFW